MSQTKVGNSLNNLPAKSVGSSITPVKPGSGAQATVTVPQPSSLSINGRATPLIDLTKNNGYDIANLINGLNIPGITASINSQGILQISGIDSISGDKALLTILGIG